MPQVINTNVASLNAQRNLNQSQSSLATSLQRMSSGLRINSAKDDAAGLAISERMTTQIRGLNQAARNANDGISLAQTAEGALGEIGNNLQRIRELAVQSRNATNSQTDRDALQKEVAQLKSEIDRVANTTSFNGTKLLDGSFTAQAFQVGANQGQTIEVSAIADANIAALGSWNTAVTTPAVATASTASGAFTAAAAGAAGQTFTLTVDGANAFTKTSTGGGGAADAVSAAEVQTGVAAFVAASNGAYTMTGTVAGGDLVLSKTDGSDMAIALNSTFATTAGSFGNAGFVATHTGGTVAVGGTAQTGFGSLDVSTVGGADNAILAMDAALNAVNSARADLGAVQNRFGSVVANLATTAENLTASRSRIQDADFAAESASLTRNQILQQAGTAMLAQANSLPQNVLSLLRG
jgi:flagellin